MRLARAQRLTGRARELGRAEARSAVRGRGVPGGSHVRPTRTTETGPRDDRPHTGATSLQTCLVFSAPRPRPSKSPGIHRKNSGPPPSDLGVRASAGLGGGGGSPERTCLARRQANKRRTRESQISPGISHFRIFDRLGVVVETAGKMPLKGFHRSNVLHHDSVGPVSGTTTDPGAHHSGDAFVADAAWPCCGNAANGWNAPTRISMKPGACGAPICAAMPTFSNGS